VPLIIIMLLGALYLLIVGGGAWSCDAWLQGRLRRAAAAPSAAQAR
jgi:hypothetical protein